MMKFLLPFSALIILLPVTNQATAGLENNEQHLSEIHCKHFFKGCPKGTPKTNDLIIRDIDSMSSNDSTKFADWVAYWLDKAFGKVVLVPQ